MGSPGFVAALVAIVLLATIGRRWLRARRPHWFHARLPADSRATIAKYFTYYGRLPPAQQRRFEHLVQSFLVEKEWIGAGITVQEEMKVMIGASAAQLLFGLPDLTLQHFDRIVVYRAAYRDHRTGRRHQGEVNPHHGIIRISWADYLQGYARPMDAHNVALHELAHALWFEDIIPNDDDDFFDREALARWKSRAHEEIGRIGRGEGKLFRDYAGSNEEEFFAVAVEYFFEQPMLFLQEQPELYDLMRQLLRQDPAQGMN